MREENRPLISTRGGETRGSVRKEDAMFQESLFRSGKNIGARAVALPAALVFHALIITSLILVPLWTTRDLPRVNFTRAIFAPPLPPPLPPAGKRHSSSRVARLKQVQSLAHLPDGKLVAPLTIPIEIAEEPSAGFGVDGGIEGIEGGWENGMFTGIVGDVISRAAGTSSDPMIHVGMVKPPHRVKRVDPIYPEVARQALVEGVVVIEAATDAYGRVVSWKVMKSIPLLDQAAVDAVRQWVYEPMIINGRPCGVVFSVTVTFRLGRE